MDVNRPSSRLNGRRPTDDELLDGAREVFAECGFHAASMDAMAARSGSTKPTLYAHFEDKGKLYQRALQREAATLERYLGDAYISAMNLPLGEQARRDVMALFEYAAAHPTGFTLLFGPQATEAASIVREELITDVQHRIAEVFRRYSGDRGRQLGPSADLMAAVSVSIPIEAARHALATPEADLDAAGEFAARYVEAALRHLEPGFLHEYDAKASCSSNPTPRTRSSSPSQTQPR
jgi:AcrR family transcriptional regulator